MERKLLLVTLMLVLLASIVNAQIHVSGKVLDGSEKIPLSGVTVIVKGTSHGTITNEDGKFEIRIDSTYSDILVFSFIGFESQELRISDLNGQETIVTLKEDITTLQEIIVKEPTIQGAIIDAPATVEVISQKDIQEAAVPNAYEMLQNIKAIDVSVQSMTFQTINPRGFGLNGNMRTVQLIDGIDNQAPGLNFPIGNIVGIPDIDLESIEVLPGAASAIYGPNALQGIILMNSKNPFEYQGLDITIQEGLNHVDERDDAQSVFHNLQLRYAKSIDRFAFKVVGSYFNANDWIGVDYRDNSVLIERSPSVDPTIEGYRSAESIAANPYLRTYNGVHVYGDEVFNVGEIVKSSDPNTYQAIAGLLPLSHHTDFSPLGYTEKEFTDNETESIKLGGAIHYKLKENIEAIAQFNIGFGSTVYTANDRYVLDNFSIWTGKLEVKGDNFFIRGYTTQEDAGDSYAANLLATLINAQTTIPAYVQTFTGARLQGATMDESHFLAREASNDTYLEVGSIEFDNLYDQLRNTPISQGGAQFLDQTSLYHAEGMYNFENQIKFAQVIIGGNLRKYDLNSGGTLFALENIDTGDEFDVNEWGVYSQVRKLMFNDRFDLTAAVRYDKNQYFDGQLSPKVSGTITLAEDPDHYKHNLRLSFQRGFRMPTAQEQFINLDIVARRLVGSNREVVEQFHFIDNPIYTSESLHKAQQSGDINDLVMWTDFDFETEKVNTYEAGYRGLTLNKKLFIDAYYYFNRYTDFITEAEFAQTATGNTNPGGQTPLYAGPSDPEGMVAETVPIQYFAFDVNTDETVESQGWAISAEYQVNRHFEVAGNVSFNDLINEEELEENGFLTYFNTPKYRYNLRFGGTNLINRKVGFNLVYRWQDAFYWEAALGQGIIPAYSTLDAQVNYKVPNLNAIVKLGGSNILNERFITSFGNPSVGAMYYVSFSFQDLLTKNR